MNLNHLEIFSAVAEAGSVTLGAERLLISQPAVSKQLKQLEKSLGVTLFERRSKPLALTESGALLARYATRIFTLVKDAEQALDDLQHLKRGRLAIGASTTIAVYLLPELLVKFRDRFPGIRVRLETETGVLLKRRLEDEKLDLGLSEAIIESPHLEAKVFAKDEFVAIAPIGHPLKKQRSVDLPQFLSQPLIVRDAGSGRQSFVQRVLGERKMRFEPVIALGSTEAVKRAVVAGLGCAIVPRRTIDLELSSRKLALIPVRNLSIQRPFYQYQLRGRKPSKAVIAFLCLLKHAVRGTLPPLKRATIINQ